MRIKWDNHRHSFTLCRAQSEHSTLAIIIIIIRGIHLLFLGCSFPQPFWLTVNCSWFWNLEHHQEACLDQVWISSCSSLDTFLPQLCEDIYFTPLKMIFSDPFLRIGNRLWELWIRKIENCPLSLPMSLLDVPYLANTSPGQDPQFWWVLVPRLTRDFALWTFRQNEVNSDLETIILPSPGNFTLSNNYMFSLLIHFCAAYYSILWNKTIYGRRLERH